jgi:hypothetical protein
MIWSRTSSRPDWICVTSTFLRQAFLPLRLGCLYCAGAASVSAMVFAVSCRMVVGFKKVRKLRGKPSRIPLLARASQLHPCRSVLGTASRSQEASALSYSFIAPHPHQLRHSITGFLYLYLLLNLLIQPSAGSLSFIMAQSGYSNPLKKFK